MTDVLDGTRQRRCVVGVTGHRELGDASDRVRAQLDSLLMEFKTIHGDGLVALSPVAEGADTLFAQSALGLGIRLEVVIPYEGYEEDFQPGPSRAEYRRLRSEAADSTTLPYLGRSDEAYAAVGEWIVDRCDHLVAVWDGRPPAGPGGTGEVVARAREAGRPVTLVRVVPEEREAQEEEMADEAVPGPTGERPSTIDKFAEYRLFIESTEKLTDRRQTATQVWMTLHTLLFAVLGFLIRAAGGTLFMGAPATGDPSGIGPVVTLLTFGPLILLGILACVIWRKMLLSYRELIGWRYDQLMEMERAPELRGAHRVFIREWEDFFGPDARRTRISFTKLEAKLPIVLLFVYGAFGIIALLLGLTALP